MKQPESAPVRIDLPFDEAIRRVLRVKPKHRTTKKPTPKKHKPKATPPR